MRWVGLGMMVVLATGCPRVGRMTFRFDLRTLHGTLIAENIGTDDAERARLDFATLVNDYLLGDAIGRDHPGWRLGERKLYERDGELNGIVDFGFGSPLAAGIYQFDKKSNFLWCAAGGEEVVMTSGEVIPPYPNCVAFGRKDKTLLVTVADGGEFRSLLPLYQAWDGNPVAVDSDAAADLGPRTGPLDDLLPNVMVPPVWAALGLPMVDGKVVYATEQALQVSHVGTAAAVLPSYESILTAAGFAEVETGSEMSRWTRGEEAVTLSATQAGGSAIVALAR